MPLVLVILTKNSYMGNQIGMKYEIKQNDQLLLRRFWFYERRYITITMVQPSLTFYPDSLHFI